jgi:hypothetical protein
MTHASTSPRERAAEASAGGRQTGTKSPKEKPALVSRRSCPGPPATRPYSLRADMIFQSAGNGLNVERIGRLSQRDLDLGLLAIFRVVTQQITPTRTLLRDPIS